MHHNQFIIPLTPWQVVIGFFDWVWNCAWLKNEEGTKQNGLFFLEFRHQCRCGEQTTKEATPVQGSNFRISLLLWLLSGSQKLRAENHSEKHVGSGVFKPWICSSSTCWFWALFLHLNKHEIWYANKKHRYQCDDMMNSLPSLFPCLSF